MADEIPNANVVRLALDGNRWCAVIGPDAQSGVMACGLNPESAIVALAVACVRRGWQFDPTWRPGKTSLHDA